MEEMPTARCGGKSLKLWCPLQGHQSPQISMWSPKLLSKPCPFGVLWRLPYIDCLDHWLLATDSTACSSPLPEVWGWDWKFQPSNHLVGSISSGVLRCFLKYLINIIKHPFSWSTFKEMPWFPSTMTQELWRKTNYLFMRNIFWSSERPIYISHKSQYCSGLYLKYPVSYFQGIQFKQFFFP